MDFRPFAAALFAVAFLVRAAPSGSPPPSWEAVDRALGTPGKDLPDAVRKYAFPRTDLAVTLDGLRIEPSLALGSWVAFQRTGSGDEAMAMGDLVLLGAEVDGAVRGLQARGFEVLAIHNHLIGEMPRLLYVHFSARGDATEIARGLRDGLAQTRTPLSPSAAPPPALSRNEERGFETIQKVLGRKGSRAGRVLQIGIPRAGRIEYAGMEVPAAMGIATALHFQMAGDRAAATGDFVLVADEVNPVVKALQAGGIAVTALHSHMLREEPRLFFLHFWALDAPQRVADGLRTAVSRVASRP